MKFNNNDGFVVGIHKHFSWGYNKSLFFVVRKSVQEYTCTDVLYFTGESVAILPAIVPEAPYSTEALSSAEASRERKRGVWGIMGTGKKANLPRDSRALTILFPSLPIDSVLSLALHSPLLENPREPLQWREVQKSKM